MQSRSEQERRTADGPFPIVGKCRCILVDRPCQPSLLAEGYSPSKLIAAKLIACDERRGNERRSAEIDRLRASDQPCFSFPSRSQGYLFKRSHNKFKTWSRSVTRSVNHRVHRTLCLRRWFCIRQGQLLYMKRNNGNSNSDSATQQPSIMVPDLRLCTIRPANDNDRRFVFEILSPSR